MQSRYWNGERREKNVPPLCSSAVSTALIRCTMHSAMRYVAAVAMMPRLSGYLRDGLPFVLQELVVRDSEGKLPPQTPEYLAALAPKLYSGFLKAVAPLPGELINAACNYLASNVGAGCVIGQPCQKRTEAQSMA